MCGSVQNVDSILEGNKEDLNLFGYVHRPYPSSYRPKLDVTDELDAELINRFQQLIVVIRWSIELGRVYIMTGISCLSQYLCSTYKGHLNSVYKIFR